MPSAASVSAAVELLPALEALAKRAATYSRTAQKANQRILGIFPIGNISSR
jgi:hypothetical protein